MRLPLTILFAGAASAAAALSAAPPAGAAEYPWCADYNLPGGATNCGFVTLAQCRAAVSGVGGHCRTNLFYAGPPAPPPPGRRYR